MSNGGYMSKYVHKSESDSTSGYELGTDIVSDALKRHNISSPTQLGAYQLVLIRELEVLTRSLLELIEQVHESHDVIQAATDRIRNKEDEPNAERCASSFATESPSEPES